MAVLLFWQTSIFRAPISYKFRIVDKARGEPRPGDPFHLGLLRRRRQPFAIHRFPLLETAENSKYWSDRGLGRLTPRVFPITVPTWRRMDPFLREYLHFLHALDPARFSVRKLAERYGLNEDTVKRICREVGRNRYLAQSGLTTYRNKQLTTEQRVADQKEVTMAKANADWTNAMSGYEQVGSEELDTPADALRDAGEQGFNGQQDWIRRTYLEVEHMTAFPFRQRKEALPKRVDVDMTVHHTLDAKVINWIDPKDKLAF